MVGRGARQLLPDLAQPLHPCTSVVHQNGDCDATRWRSASRSKRRNHAGVERAPYPLGATWDGMGVNFALFSENATGVELCLFSGPDDAIESHHSRCGNAQTRCGTASCPTCVLANSMATGCTGRTSPTLVTASIRPSSSSIPTRKPSPVAYGGMTRLRLPSRRLTRRRGAR